MNKILQLRQEIAKERLSDLSKEYGTASARVNNYKSRMKGVLNNLNKLDLSTLNLNE